MPKIKKINKNSEVGGLVLAESELQKLAHSGTKEAIAKIEAYMKSEKDYDKKAYAELALEECELFYYQPKNEKEEREFTLCKVVSDHERRISDLKAEAGKIEANLERYGLEQAVHKQVLTDHKNKKDDWQYRYMDDFMLSDHNRLKELKDDIAYEKAWVIAAKKMISTPKYKDGIPERHLSHYDFDFNDDEFEDDGSRDCCDDGCSCCEAEEGGVGIVSNEIPF